MTCGVQDYGSATAAEFLDHPALVSGKRAMCHGAARDALLRSYIALFSGNTLMRRFTGPIRRYLFSA
jgi:hypothetical protein